jgi:hypothetical protein
MKIDLTRLLDFLDEQEAGLRAARTEQEDGSVAAHRLDGGLIVIKRLRETIPTATRTPVKEISTETKSKLRRYDPDTSLQAALSQTPEKSRALYTVIFGLLDRKPMTDEELLDVFERGGKNVTASGVRSRRAELTEVGWVRDSGQKRQTKAGHPSIVWEAVK